MKKSTFFDLGLISACFGGVFAVVLVTGFFFATKIRPRPDVAEQVAACAHQCESFDLEMSGVTTDASGVRECHCARAPGARH